MSYLEVARASALAGTVRIQGSKNSTLSLMAAACLSSGTVVLENVPDISDVHTFLDILRDMGAKAGFIDTNRIMINSQDISSPFVDPKHSKKVRPSYYFIGSLLARHKTITLGYPGGDLIGQRPIDQHIKGFEQMGAGFEFDTAHYTVTAGRLKGCEVYFDVVTGGATINLMLAAVLAKGTTTLHNAACDPEVVDTAILLNKMGAKIHGAGTNRIRIDGVESLCGCSHTVIPDRLIAGTYMLACGISGGKVTVENVIPEHLLPLIYKLTEAGLDFEVGENAVTVLSDGSVKPLKIIAEKFPKFETDFQQPITALLLKANGKSVITDRVYPHRSAHCEELVKMGADIEWKNGSAQVFGGNPLYGTTVHARDIRAGTCLVLASLMANGVTHVYGYEHIARGFSDIAGDLTTLGAPIKLYGDTKPELLYHCPISLKNRV